MVYESFKLMEFVAHGSSVNCLAFGQSTGSVLATGGDDRLVRLWKVGSPQNLLSLSGAQSPVTSVVFNTTEEQVLGGSSGGSVKLYDLSAGKVSRTLTGHLSDATAVAFHPHGPSFAASGSRDTKVKVWDLKSKTCITTYKGHAKEVTDVKFSPDGRWVASSSLDGLVRLYDLAAGKVLSEFTLPDAVTCIGFNPSELLLTVNTTSKVTTVFDLERFNTLGSTGLVGTSAGRTISHDTDGRMLYVGHTDVVKEYDLTRPEELAEKDEEDHTTNVGWGKVFDTVVCESPDGRTQLLGGSFTSSFVNLYVVDLTSKISTSNVASTSTVTRPVSSGRRQPPETPVEEQPVIASPPPPEDIPVTVVAPAQPSDHRRPVTPGVTLPERKEVTPRPTSSSGRKSSSSPVKPELFPVQSVVPLDKVNNSTAADSKLDFSSFNIAHSDNTNTSNSIQVLSSMMNEGQDTFVNALTQRLNTTSRVTRTWGSGDFKKALRTLSEISPQALQSMIVVDVLRAFDWSINSTLLDLDACDTLFPLCNNIIVASDNNGGGVFESYVPTAIDTMTKLLNAFSCMIKSTRALRNKPNQNLNFEDRLAKCDACVGHFSKTCELLSHDRKNKTQLNELLDAFFNK